MLLETLCNDTGLEMRFEQGEGTHIAVILSMLQSHAIYPYTSLLSGTCKLSVTVFQTLFLYFALCLVACL